ncbi:hypothetical protein ACLQ2O_30120 [Kribbella sp. DT2]
MPAAARSWRRTQQPGWTSSRRSPCWARHSHTGLWAFQYLGHDIIRQLLAVSFLPFLTALLRYDFLISTGRGELPEHDLFRDRVLLVAGAT